MKTNIFSILIACFVITSMFSQSSLNDYKYVIVPDRFDFLKDKDQYQINSLTQFLFKKNGFIAIMEGRDYPEDLLRNRCLGLNSDVIKESGLFKTKLTVQLKDCNDKIIYTSGIGESREKEFKTAYNLALRDAFKSIEKLNYNYQPNKKVKELEDTKQENNGEAKAEIKQLKEEIKTLKEEKKAETPKVEKPVVTKPATNQKVVTIVEVQTKQNDIIEGHTNILYAQEIENGFQLVDSAPKVVYKIKKTGQTNLFLVESKSAIIYKKGDNWVLEYYENNVLKQESLNIKF